MANNGERFLERTRYEFLEDLMRSFGERSDGFSEELKVTLFELWARARSRPPFPEHRPEPTELMKQSEFEMRLINTLRDIEMNAAELELRSQFARALASRIVASSGLRSSSHGDTFTLETTSSGGFPDQHQLSQALMSCLEVSSGLEKVHDTSLGQLTLGLSASGSNPPDWLPVFQHTSGQRAALDLDTLQKVVHHQVNTHLTHDGVNWVFPNPKPVYTGDDMPHVSIYVDEVEQSNSLLMWGYSWSNERADNVADWVSIPTAMTNQEVVRAVYSTTVKDFGL